MKKFYLKTYGCQLNFSDSERILNFLSQKGFKQVLNADKADLVILNTCGVRETAENRVFSKAHKIRQKNPEAKIVLTGCLAHRTDVQRKLKEKVDEFIRINDFLGCNNYFKITPKYKQKNSIFVPIMTGCNNYCSYCVVPYARGHEWSRPVIEIEKEIEQAIKNGAKEVMLLGQNVNSYKGRKGRLNFPKLLERLAKKFPKIRFKFLTSHPKDFLDDLIEVIRQNKNISREIHLPVQSGSDKILKAMHRPYNQASYLTLIKKIRTRIPKVKITTDVIIGFPGEDEKEFLETVKVFKKAGFTHAYINKYSPRPETAAYKLGDPVPWSEKKKREKRLLELIKTSK